MSMGKTQTSQFLQRWHDGDPKGLEDLLARHLPWIRARVSKRMGPVLRRKAETTDYVQDAMVEFLRYGPRILISDGDHFRALLVRIVENALRDKHDWFTRRRRAVSRERPLPADTVLSLDPPRARMKTPSAAAGHHEREAWVRLGMELLEPEDREVLVLRQWENLSFAEIGERLGISKDAARMRNNRAVSRLGEIVGSLRRRNLPEAEGEAEFS